MAYTRSSSDPVMNIQHPRLKRIRLLLIGDDGVGKTSLILSLVSEQFPQNVPAKVENIVIPGEVCPEKIPTVLVDYSSRDQDEDDLNAEIVRSDVICVVYSLADKDTLERVNSHWLPKIRSFLGKSHTTPIILVGNKSDLVKDDAAAGDSAGLQQSLDDTLPIMNTFNEIETVVECSAKTMKNLVEMFYYAQKAVLHPFGPLFDIAEGRLSDKCVAALARIFRVADLDGDGVWNESEMQEFQERVFQAPLLPHALDDVKTVVGRNVPEGIRNGGLTLDGFVFLNLFFVQRGRHEATWATLRAFGYADNLELEDTYRSPPVPEMDDNDPRVVELADQGMSYLMWLFTRYDADKDDHLSPAEFYNLLSTCPKVPFGADVFNSVETDARGFVTRAGFRGLWALVTHSNVKLAFECLAYFGYQWHMQEKTQLKAFKLSKERRVDVSNREVNRDVLLCNVIGDRGAGKTCFLQGLLNRNRQLVEQRDRDMIPQYTVHPINVYGARKFLVLHKVREDVLDPRELKCDAVCFLFNPARLESLQYVTDYYSRYQSHFDQRKVPCIFVATKADLFGSTTAASSLNSTAVIKDSDGQSVSLAQVSAVLKKANAFVKAEGLPPLDRFCAVGENINRSIYTKLTTMATYPNLKPMLKVLLLQGASSWLTTGGPFGGVWNTASSTGGPNNNADYMAGVDGDANGNADAARFVKQYAAVAGGSAILLFAIGYAIFYFMRYRQNRRLILG